MTALTPPPPPPSVSTPLSRAVNLLDRCSLSPGEVVADLGSGDGRIPILAALLFETSRAFGIEKDPGLARRSRQLVRTLGLGEKVQIICCDLLDADLSEFDAITIFQSQGVIERLVPKLLRELRPGTRVVSYLLPLGGYSPLALLKPSSLAHPFYVYAAPMPALDEDDSLNLLREIARHAEKSEAEWSRVWEGLARTTATTTAQLQQSSQNIYLRSGGVPSQC